MCEPRGDGEAPLWRPRVDAWALAATSAPSLLGLNLGYPRKSERKVGQAAQGPALLPLRGARCRRRGRPRLAVATTRGRRVPQRFHSVAMWRLWPHHAIARRRDCVYVVSSLGRSYLEIRFAVRCVFDAVADDFSCLIELVEGGSPSRPDVNPPKT